MSIQGELSESELAFLREAEPFWGERDTALARWSFINDLNPAERKIASSLRARVKAPKEQKENKKGSKKNPGTPERKEELCSYRLLAAPALLYGLSAESEPMRRAERLGWLAVASSCSFASMDFSFKRHFFKNAGLVALDVFFTINFFSLIFANAALFFSGGVKGILYGLWVASVAISWRYETKIKRKLPRTPTRLIFSLVFPWKAQRAQMRLEMERAWASAMGVSAEQAKEIWDQPVLGLSEATGSSEWSEAWDGLALSRGLGSAIQRAQWTRAGKSPLSVAEIEQIAREQALAMAQSELLEAELNERLPLAPSESPRPRSRSL